MCTRRNCTRDRLGSARLTLTPFSIKQISTDGPDHNVLKIKPPLCFSKSDAGLLARAIEQALAECEAQ